MSISRYFAWHVNAQYSYVRIVRGRYWNYASPYAQRRTNERTNVNVWVRLSHFLLICLQRTLACVRSFVLLIADYFHRKVYMRRYAKHNIAILALCDTKSILFGHIGYWYSINILRGFLHFVPNYITYFTMLLIYWLFWWWEKFVFS